MLEADSYTVNPLRPNGPARKSDGPVIVSAAALQRKVALPRSRKLDGRQEAQLIALACSTVPEGHKRWTLKLLAKQLVELEDLDGLAPETVRQILKKTSSNHG